jgi:hypothetical protein
MGTTRATLLGFVVFAWFVGCHQTASAAPVYMPPGSTVWMKFQASAIPGTDSDDVVGSNQAGVAPPNGIPVTTVSDGVSTATGYAEILPNQVRTFLSSTSAGRMWASFQDTYTVGGTASGPFDITFQLSVSGIMRSVPAGPFHQLLGASINAEIGTFNPASDGGGIPLLEQFRITPFPDQPSASSFYIHPTTDSRSAPFSLPVSTTATYTKTGVNVGDVITIAYGVNSAFSKGEIDLLNTGIPTFATPDGVTLTSSLAQAIPEPAGCALLALCLPLLARRRVARAGAAA